MLRAAEHHRITYIARSNGDAEDDRGAAEFLADHGIEPILVTDPVPVKSGSAFYARLATNVLSSVPYSVQTHDTARMRAEVQRYAAEHAVDLWQFEWTPYVAALRHRPDERKVVVAHNVDTLIWQRYYQTARNPLKRWFARQQWRKFAQFERRAYSEATRVVAVSDEDASRLRSSFRCTRVDVVENGIDRERFEAVIPRHDPRRILFLGALDWRPNLDAVGLLLDSIYPAVRAREPAARLDLVGRSPPGWLAARANRQEGISLHADVPDVRPYLARSGVLAVPLRIGGGSRLKILEALACGLPVVSTRVGAEGLRVEPGKHLTIVPDAEGMTDALVHCLRRPERAAAMAAAGRAHVLAEYDWDAIALEQERVWERCVGAAPVVGAGRA